MEISHNLEVAKPNFLYFINNMNPELARWVQYSGIETEGSRIIFNFKSSQNSLNFSIYGGVNTNQIDQILRSKSNDIYNYFRNLKNETINK
jgi:hypothetical protein